MLPSVSLAQQARAMIESISPTAGPIGSQVSIVGRNFRPSARVLFNERPLTAEVRPERIVITVPNDARDGRFVVQHGNDEVESSVFRVTAAAAAPIVTAIEPSSAAPGSELVITGQNFGARVTDNNVRIGTLPMIVRSGDATTLRVIVPSGAQSGVISVRTSGGEAQSPPLTIAARVMVSEFAPTAAAPGQRITIRGSGLTPTAGQTIQVLLGTRAVRVLDSNATEIQVEVPRNATEGGRFTVVVPGAGRFETGASLRVAPAPVISAIAPLQGSPGARITLTGERFGSDPTALRVTLGESVARVLAVTPTSAEIEVPRGAGSGRFQLTIGGIGPVESPADFRVLEPLTVAGFTPTAGDVGDRVSLQGTGFSPNPAEITVRLGTAQARVVSVAGREIVVEVPPNARSSQWTVGIAGNGETRSRQPFMVTMRPRITALEPDRGILGTQVTLRGVNFPSDRALVQVRLNDVEVPVESVSREAIVVTVPTAGLQPGPAQFSVIARLQGTGRAPMEWFVLVPSRITALEPAAAAPGSSVVIRGDGFESDPSRLIVRLGTQAVRPTSVSPTAIVFTVPRNAQSGSVSLEAVGRAPASAALRVTNPPAIRSVSPNKAPPGGRIVIRGDRFGADATAVSVLIGEVACTVSVVTPREIVAQLPANAQTGRITVRVQNEGEAVSARPMRVEAPRR
ncbi:MAG: IPT/TIG domain-containing protein [Deltaproteobacteria bacterium]|nr:IPT/TIG domain-containing protein [Deltaproteobacteria bacterium]